jgi:hypothetical protein
MRRYGWHFTGNVVWNALTARTRLRRRLALAGFVILILSGFAVISWTSYPMAVESSEAHD